MEWIGYIGIGILVLLVLLVLVTNIQIVSSRAPTSLSASALTARPGAWACTSKFRFSSAL